MTQASTQNNQQAEDRNVPALAPPRLPYHPAVEERFGVDKASWKALVEAVFPMAQTTESIILALSYCRARNLDPFKKNVHIVPIWDSQKNRMVDTIWPGIGELRTTAFRTGLYAGRDATVFGDDQAREWDYQPKNGPKRTISVTFPEWAQVTVYRVVNGERVPFQGPRVYWLETYATMRRSDAPNSMWERRPRGQLDKCAEAAALRAAFPEEMGDALTDSEVGVVSYPGSIINQDGSEAAASTEPPAPGRHKLGESNEPHESSDASSDTELTSAAEGAEGATDASDHEQTTDDASAEPEAPESPDQDKPDDEALEPWEKPVAALAEQENCTRESAAERLATYCNRVFKSDLPDLEDAQLTDLMGRIERGDIKLKPEQGKGKGK